LDLAAQKGYTSVVKVLLNAGADTDFRMPRDGAGNAMMVAQQQSFEAPKAAKGQPGVVDEEALYKWSKQFNQAGAGGMRPPRLHACLWLDSTRLPLMLHVLDPSAAGFEQGNGASALHAAVENDHLEVTVQHAFKMLLAGF
jgi:hypothetical protein